MNTLNIKRRVAAERARRTLVDLLPFVACTARCHNSLVGDDRHLPAVELEKQDDAYDLVGVPAPPAEVLTADSAADPADELTADGPTADGPTADGPTANAHEIPEPDGPVDPSEGP
jgi:hypothetical protein